jgi:hypothetical protein
MTYLDILKSSAEKGNVKSIPYEVELTYSSMGL